MLSSNWKPLIRPIRAINIWIHPDESFPSTKSSSLEVLVLGCGWLTNIPPQHLPPHVSQPAREPWYLVVCHDTGDLSNAQKFTTIHSLGLDTMEFGICMNTAQYGNHLQLHTRTCPVHSTRIHSLSFSPLGLSVGFKPKRYSFSFCPC